MEDVVTTTDTRLKLGKSLGKGSFATVYAAEYDGVGEVAIKVLHPHLKPSAELFAAAERQKQPSPHQSPLSTQDPNPEPGTSVIGDQGSDGETAFKLFLREALVMSKLSHRCLVKCHGIQRLPHDLPGLRRTSNDASDARWCMMLERCLGESLSKVLMNHMQHKTSYSTRDLLSWLHDIADAISYLHDQQPCVIHRDLKCENVLLRRPHKKDACVPAVVTDLGLHVRVGSKRDRKLRRQSNTGSLASNPQLADLPVPTSIADDQTYTIAAAESTSPTKSGPRVQFPAPEPMLGFSGSIAAQSPFITQREAEAAGLQLPEDLCALPGADQGALDSPVRNQTRFRAELALLNALSSAPAPDSKVSGPSRDVSPDRRSRVSFDVSTMPTKGPNAPRAMASSSPAIPATGPLSQSVRAPSRLGLQTATSSPASREQPCSTSQHGEPATPTAMRAGPVSQTLVATLSNRSASLTGMESFGPTKPSESIPSRLAGPSGRLRDAMQSAHSESGVAPRLRLLKSDDDGVDSPSSTPSRLLTRISVARSMAGSEWGELLSNQLHADSEGLPLQGLARNVMSQLSPEELAWVYSLTGGTGSAMYMAPEVTKSEPYNEKVDVFSFGVIAYELLARGLLMFSHIDTATLPGVELPDQYALLVANGYRPSRPACLLNSVEEQLWELVQRCWSQDPNTRPSMHDVCLLLEVLMEELERTQSVATVPKKPGGACCTVM